MKKLETQLMFDFEDGNGPVPAHHHKNPDGSVSDTAWVSDTARVSGNAWVSDNAWIFGNTRIFDNARIYGNARISDTAWVYGTARVYGNARISGYARVYGNAWVFEGEYQEPAPETESVDECAEASLEASEPDWRSLFYQACGYISGTKGWERKHPEEVAKFFTDTTKGGQE